MILRAIFTAVTLLAFPVSAFAHSCPSIMAEIDAALPNADLSEEERAQVTELRMRGEEEHQAGNHDASIATLEEAKGILGI